jgi:hypothetical protein
MHIEIFGLDKYVVATLSEQLHLPLIKLTKVNEKDLFFSVFESMIFHQGVDQNAWHTIIRIFLVEANMKYQEEIKALFVEALKDQTIHLHFEFYPQLNQNIHHVIREDYPLFVSESNAVKIQEDLDPLITQEIFHGNVFEGKEKELETIIKPTKKKKPS